MVVLFVLVLLVMVMPIMVMLMLVLVVMVVVTLQLVQKTCMSQKAWACWYVMESRAPAQAERPEGMPDGRHMSRTFVESLVVTRFKGHECHRSMHTLIEGSGLIRCPVRQRYIIIASKDALHHAERLARGMEGRIAPKRQEQHECLVSLQIMFQHVNTHVRSSDHESACTAS